MIVSYDYDDKCWRAAGKGYMRPIVVEAETRTEAMNEYMRLCESQQADEYHMEQSMTALALEQPYGAKNDG